MDIDKWSMVSDASGTDVGNLSSGNSHYYGAGISSETTGYACGGINIANSLIYNIEKVSFASDGNATAYSGVVSGSPSHARGLSGSSSTTHGYCSGGGTIDSAPSNIIDKFSYASEGNASDVGDLPGVPSSAGSIYSGATQY